MGSSPDQPADRRPLSRWLWALPATLRWAALSLLIVGLARPQVPEGEVRVQPRGVAIVLLIDTSLSMVVRDFTLDDREISRLEAVKWVATRFVRGDGRFSGRASDQIGLVTFANFTDVVCPLTLTHSALLRSLSRLKPSPVYEQGTNIGDGILAALELLKTTEARSKVIVLLTDGVNEPAPLAGHPPPIDPLDAAALAASLGVRIYTIGTGTWSGRFWYRDPDTGHIHTPIAKPMDRRLLRGIADRTGGRFWVAAELQELHEIWEELDQLEPSVVGAVVYRDYVELFPYVGWLALALLLVERAMVVSRWRLLESPVAANAHGLR